jgi:hypothetical protein
MGKVKDKKGRKGMRKVDNTEAGKMEDKDCEEDKNRNNAVQ